MRDVCFFVSCVAPGGPKSGNIYMYIPGTKLPGHTVNAPERRLHLLNHIAPGGVYSHYFWSSACLPNKKSQLCKHYLSFQSSHAYVPHRCDTLYLLMFWYQCLQKGLCPTKTRPFPGYEQCCSVVTVGPTQISHQLSRARQPVFITMYDILLLDRQSNGMLKNELREIVPLRRQSQSGVWLYQFLMEGTSRVTALILI